jgi:tRNA 2-selenouridine synthase
MAWLFSRLGIHCHLLQGGYKAFRRYGRELVSQNTNLVVLGGMTGSGKTEILDELRNRGEQVLNLEYLAHHKGSAFGSIGEDEQYATEHFENLIFEQYTRIDFDKTLWVEDESKKIGKNIIPDELFIKMRQSPVIKLNIPKGRRVERLVKQYAEYGDDQLKESIQKINKRLGFENAQQAIDAIESHDYHKAANIVLNYYDKSYNYGLSKRDPSTVFEMAIQEDKPQQNAGLVKEFALKKIMILSS